jgi:hypothetical protein
MSQGILTTLGQINGLMFMTLRNYNMIHKALVTLHIFSVNLLSPQKYAILRHNEQKYGELSA